MSEHLTAGITHPEKVNPSRGSNSASRSSGHSGRRVRTSVSQACGSRPLRFAVSSKLIICAARSPAIRQPSEQCVSGRQFYRQFLAIAEQVNQQAAQGFSPEERDTLRQLLLRLADNLSETQEDTE